jgi:predicted ATP-grasp superfamily ATP-dependent carboligase
VGEPILLVAISARMLAELAVRAGREVVALDRFGDLDLQRLCPSVSVLRDLGGRGGMAALVDAAEEVHAPSVIYGAGLENNPRLVTRLATGRRLLGCPPETLERVRDPATLGASLRAADLAYPATFGPRDAPRPVERTSSSFAARDAPRRTERTSSTVAARDAPRRTDRPRRWLRKPVRGGGGRGVREWRGGALRGEVVVQEHISGLACSVAAVADGRSAAVLGVSEQLIGQCGFGARGYAWCGNLVPPRLGEAQRCALAAAARAICAHLARAFRLRGLFGVDLVWDGEHAWVVEVNPRPTGSLECVEAAHDVGVFAAHLDGCAGRLPQVAPAQAPRRAAGKAIPFPPAHAPRRAAGKAIVFATRDVRVGDTRDWPARGIRDVPHPGERIAAGAPICTLVSVQESPDTVFADLEARAAALRAELDERAALRAHA